MKAGNDRYKVLVFDRDKELAVFLRAHTNWDILNVGDHTRFTQSDARLNIDAALIDFSSVAGEAEAKALAGMVHTKWPEAPIIAIVSDYLKTTSIAPLDFGIKDFITKPIDINELALRLQIRIKQERHSAARHSVLFGDITIRSDARKLEGPNKTRLASPIEIGLIKILALANGDIVDKEALKLNYWGQSQVTDNALHRKLHTVRRILKDISPNVSIETKYGAGFYLSYNEQLNSLEAS
jgi:DNA-binding response OmpR family regulator